MALGKASKTVLIIDDEPEYLGWVAEFLLSLGLTTEWAVSLGAAMAKLQEKQYRLMLVDMNIPADGAAVQLAKNPVQQKYPGIVAAVRARSLGYGAHQVVAYTVHDDDAADAELQKLNCRYVLKGRPDALKGVIKASVRAFPPVRRSARPRSGQASASRRRRR